jgi:hypothetical protein
MGFFNMIETFFFISLGITFVLILMLVYHFKQRLSTIETETKTMFQIVNGIVKELSGVKMSTIQIQNALQENYLQSNPLNYKQYTETGHNSSYYENTRQEDEDADNADDEDEDNKNDLSSESTSSDEYDDDDSTSIESEFNYVEKNNNITTQEPTEDKIKVVNIELTNQVDSVSDNYNDETEDDNEYSEVVENIIESIETNAQDDIIVNKLEESNHEEHIQGEQELKEESKDTYKKMNIHQLRALIINYGLASDTSKIKKQEAIKILEDYDASKNK